jgi:hypothetical protein
MKKLIALFIVLFFNSLYCVAQSNAWNPIGANDFNQATCSTTDRAKSDFALSPNGTPYIVFEDWANFQRLSVRRYNGTNWEYVGSPAISSGYISHPKIAFDNTGTPHIAFIDANNSSKIAVLKFNGTTWINVGAVGFTPANVSGCAMTVDASNNVYVGYYELMQSKMFVHKFDGTSWSVVGAGFGSAVTAQAKDIKVDATGKIYLLFGTYVGFYNGTAWAILPKPTNSLYITMALDNLGQPYVAFDSTTAATSTSRVRCMFYNGTSWVGSAGGTVATKTLSSFAYEFTRIHFGQDNKLYVAFGEANGGNYVPRLYLNNGSSWTAVGTFSTYPFKIVNNYAYLGVDNTGKINHGYTMKDYNFGALIYTYSSTIWNLLGNKDATDGQRGRSFSMDIAANGHPYIAEIINDAAFGRIAVRKYNGVKWDSVGVSNFNFSPSINFSSNAYAPKIKIGSTGTPYVGYTYGSSGSYNATAKKFNGTAWVNLIPTATPVIPCGNSNIDIDFLPNDTVLLMTSNVNAAPTVYKFNGTNWVALGGTINLPGNTSTVSNDLTVDPFGVPYIAYVRSASVSTPSLTGLRVEKYVNGAWQSVGSGTLATGLVTDVTLKFDASGVPYVAFQCDNNLPSGRKANVMKFNGTNWISVGNANFTSSTADMLKMDLDNSGNPFVVFQVNTSVTTSLSATKLTAMQYNGSAWITIGGPSHSAANVAETALIKNPLNGNITEAYMNLNSFLPSPNGALAGLIWLKEWGATTSSINEQSLITHNAFELKVHPNPSTNELYLTSELLSEDLSHVAIFDLNGRLLLSEPVSLQNNLLNTSSLSPGVYVILLNDKNERRAIQKFVKH